jgi:hypothetical protein
MKTLLFLDNVSLISNRESDFFYTAEEDLERTKQSYGGLKTGKRFMRNMMFVVDQIESHQHHQCDPLI